MLRLFFSVILTLVTAFSALAGETGSNSVLVFGGAMMKGHFPGSAIIPFGSGFDDRYIAGAAVQHEFYRFGNGIKLGAEAGLAARFGADTSGEVWAGGSIGHTGLTLGAVNISPGLVVGLTAVSKTVGIEKRRESDRKGNGKLLFYLGPELAFTHQSHPNVSLVYRIHHRSGAWNVLGHMRDGYNANVIGLRFNY